MLMGECGTIQQMLKYRSTYGENTKRNFQTICRSKLKINQHQNQRAR